jgi:hypothetical protein
MNCRHRHFISLGEISSGSLALYGKPAVSIGDTLIELVVSLSSTS